jgi:hypothetical protein
MNDLDVALMSAEDIRNAINSGKSTSEMVKIVECAHRVCPDRLDEVAARWRTRGITIYSPDLRRALETAGYVLTGRDRNWRIV